VSYFVGYVLEFDDDGEPEQVVIQRGLPALEDAARIAYLLPAVVYSGARRNPRATLVWGPEETRPADRREEG